MDIVLHIFERVSVATQLAFVNYLFVEATLIRQRGRNRILKVVDHVQLVVLQDLELSLRELRDLTQDR